MKTYQFNADLKFIRNDIKGNLVIDNEFVFDVKKDKLPFQNLAKWMLTPNPQRAEKKLDTFTPTVISNSSFIENLTDKIVWVGHSSFYMQLNNKHILTDPVFYDLKPFLKRKHALPCPISTFTNIDYILLSHGHRDHLDEATLKKLAKQNPTCEVLCPLGFDNMLRKLGFTNIQEAAWWQQYKIEDLEVTFLPAKHWNRRFITDYNTTLWGSFAIQTTTKNIYFAGDTGYDKHFTEINNHFPTFDICMMPVGAYKPKFVMEWAHTSPEESVRAFHELKGKTFIPMHYGTFDLSDEPASEPAKILQQLEKENAINGTLKVLHVGEEFLI
ncbi:MAG TPA: MBL fold metallo-hydrolase [Chitinophagales bacterium]|nr:MBL fold metallo-hydrolase [Chitinophagales bacterium]